MPVAQSRVTAIAFHAAGPGPLPLKPLGRQANQGAASRLFHRLFGGGGSGLRYYLVSGGTGVETGELDVGAATGTDVYAPVDGTVVGIAPNVLDGKRYGVRLDLQPSGSPSVVLSLTHLRIDPSLAVGDAVIASSSKLGRVLDFSGVEQQSLARYTRTPATTWRSRCTRPRRCQCPEHPLRRGRVRHGRPDGGRGAPAGLREELDVGFCVVNGENAADGAGITPRLADRLLAAGADVVTLGNHTWRRRRSGPTSRAPTA
jgi:hypothetical protein